MITNEGGDAAERERKKNLETERMKELRVLCVMYMVLDSAEGKKTE